MNRYISRRWFLAAATLLMSTSLWAQKWEYLGNAHVDGGSDHDTIRVGESKGMLRRIQIHVQDSAVHFDHILVHYGDGSAYPVEVRANVPAGGTTREIDLPGEKRWIDSVEFWYEKGNWANGRKPQIRLMGIRW